MSLEPSLTKDPQAATQLSWTDERSPAQTSERDHVVLYGFYDDGRGVPSPLINRRASSASSEESIVLERLSSSRSIVLERLSSSRSIVSCTHEFKMPYQAKSGLHSFIQLSLAAAIIFTGSFFSYITHVELEALQKDYATALATIQSLNTTATAILATGTCSSTTDLTEDMNAQVSFLLYFELDRAQTISNELREKLDDYYDPAMYHAYDEDKVKLLFSELERAHKISNELREKLDENNEDHEDLLTKVQKLNYELEDVNDDLDYIYGEDKELWEKNSTSEKQIKLNQLVIHLTSMMLKECQLDLTEAVDEMKFLCEELVDTSSSTPKNSC